MGSACRIPYSSACWTRPDAIGPYSQAKKVKAKLLAIMNEQHDSLRFYYLGNNYEHEVEHFGAKAGYDAEGVLMI